MNTIFGDIKVSRYQKLARSDVLDFVRRVYPREQCTRLIAQWAWKYDLNPFNHEGEPYILLAYYGNTIIGMMGAIPLRVSVRGREIWVMNSADARVHPRYRRHGIGLMMLQTYMRDQSVGFSWANPIVFRITIARRISPGARIFPWIKPLFPRHIIGIPAPVRADKPTDLAIHRFEVFDERFDSLWERARGNHVVLVVRDCAYLNWRFGARPDARYTVLGATRGDHLLGYLVLRASQRGRWRVGYLADWLVEDDAWDVFASLVETASMLLTEMGTAFISTRTMTPRYQDMLSRLGFRAWHWNRPAYLVTRMNLSDPDLQVFANPREWFMTMGDGDLEMSL